MATTFAVSNKIPSPPFTSVYTVGTNAIAGSGGSGSGIYYSSDSGQTWIPSNITTGTFTSVFMVGANAIAGSNSGIYYSSNSGQTWIPSNIISGSFPVNSLIMSPTSGNAIAGNYYSLNACFNENTIICIYKNEIEIYENITNISVGDLIKTYNGDYKPVKYLYRGTFLNDNTNDLHSMYKMKDTNFIVTGGHSILVDELTETETNNQNSISFKTNISDKHLLLACFSDKFEKIENNELYNVYHLVLESKDKSEQFGIYANNGILTESMKEEYYLNGK